MAKTVRVFEISTTSISNLKKKEIACESVNDTDLGWKMWGGKNASSEQTKFLGKDKPLRVTTIEGTESLTLATGASVTGISTDGTFADSSDTILKTSDAIKTYIDTQVSGIVTDHGNLTGLSDDDHSQYILTSGARELAANWDAGGFGITATHFTATTGNIVLNAGYVDSKAYYYINGAKAIHTDGVNNIVVGAGAGNDGAGEGGTFIGGNSGRVVTGNYNTGIAFNTLYNTTTGYENVAIAYQAMYENITGYRNVAIGRFAMYAPEANVFCIAIGYNAMRQGAGGGSSNVGIGAQSGFNMTTCQRVIGIGDDSNYSVTTSPDNLSIGYRSCYNLQAGIGNNISIGNYSMYSSVGSYYNISIGYETNYLLETGVANVSIGQQCQRNNISSSYNTTCGAYSLRKNLAELNTAHGYSAGYENTTGVRNVFLGVYAGRYNQTGTRNVFIGAYAGANSAVYSSTGNVCIGYTAGYSIGNSTSYNVFLGFSAGFYETGSSKLFIDNQVRSSEANGRISALLYGEFNSTVSSQLLRINATVQLYQDDLYMKWGAGADSGIKDSGTHMVFDADLNSVTGRDFYFNNGNIVLQDGKNFVLGTTTGTKIGTSATQKIGFYNATPIVQQAHIVDADGSLADITSKFNTLLSYIENLGLSAAS